MLGTHFETDVRPLSFAHCAHDQVPICFSTCWMSRGVLVVAEAVARMPSDRLCQFLCIYALKFHENPIQSLRETSVSGKKQEIHSN